MLLRPVMPGTGCRKSSMKMKILAILRKSRGESVTDDNRRKKSNSRSATGMIMKDRLLMPGSIITPQILLYQYC
jgi:hypothetical protein